MTDTPQHIQDLQLELWLKKSPGERLLQGLKNNEAVYLLFKPVQDKLRKENKLPRIVVEQTK